MSFVVRSMARGAIGLGVAIAVAFLAVPVTPVDAHEHREVGPYTFTVGWTSEPALVGEPNKVSIRIEDPAGDAETAGVEGLELEVEVTHVETGESRTFALRGAFGDPGHYIADLIPTLTGVYSFRVTGDAEGTAVDEVFEAGPNTFSPIEGLEDLQFPVQVTGLRELQSVTEGMQQSVIDAEDQASSVDDSASTAQVLSIVALVVGVLGLAAGGAGVALTRRR